MKTCTDAIKSGIVKVIVLITTHFILYILEIILLCLTPISHDNYENQSISKNSENEKEEKKDNNNGLSERIQIINVKKNELKIMNCEKFEIKNYNENLDKDELIKLYKEIQKKNEEISELKSLNPYNLKKGEQLYSIVFLSNDYTIINNFSLICKNTDPFSKLEQTLYDKFPILKETEINFNIVNRNVVNRFKTLEENNIISGNVIQICKLDVE